MSPASVGRELTLNNVPPPGFSDSDLVASRRAIRDAIQPPSPQTGVHAIENLANRRRAFERWNGFEARLARDRRTRRDAFRLRHLCYTSKGYIDVRADGEFHDEFDTRPDNTTIVIYDEDRPIGSVRVCTMEPQARRRKVAHLPVAHVFPQDVAALLGERRRAVEINRLVCDPAHDQSLGLVFILMRMADFVIRRHDPDFVTSCVRSNHVGFYKRLKFEQLAGPRLYTGLKFMTTFMAARREIFDMVRETVPMLQISPGAAASYARLWDGHPVAVFDQ